MKRDKAKETELKQQLDAAEKQFKTQVKNVTYVKSAVYNQDDTDRGPKGPLLFLGAKFKSRRRTRRKFVDKLQQAAKRQRLQDRQDLGRRRRRQGRLRLPQSTGQKARSAPGRPRTPIGELVPDRPRLRRQQLAKIMLDVREDVETTE